MEKIKDYISNWIDDGFTLNEISSIIKRRHPDLSQREVDSLLNSRRDLSPSYYLKQKVNKCDIVQDLAGDDNHYSATIKSVVFKGKSKIEQHKLVYKALGGKMGNELHALALNTIEK